MSAATYLNATKVTVVNRWQAGVGYTDKLLHPYQAHHRSSTLPDQLVEITTLDSWRLHIDHLAAILIYLQTVKVKLVYFTRL